MKSTLLNKLFVAAVAFVPWLVSMYALYFFETEAVWTTETKYRDVMTIAILVAGMGTSFVLYGWLSKKRQT